SSTISRATEKFRTSSRQASNLRRPCGARRRWPSAPAAGSAPSWAPWSAACCARRWRSWSPFSRCRAICHCRLAEPPSSCLAWACCRPASASGFAAPRSERSTAAFGPKTRLASGAGRSCSRGASAAPASCSRRLSSTCRRSATTPPASSWIGRPGFDRGEAAGAARDFIASCEAERQAQQVRTRIEQLDAQLAQLRAPSERSMAERAKADEYSRQLAAIYTRAGITDPDMEGAAVAWEAAVSHAEAYRTSSVRLAELESQRGGVTADEAGSLRQLVDDLTRPLGAGGK